MKQLSAVIAITVLTGCHTIAIKNSQIMPQATDPRSDLIEMTAHTGSYGFTRTESSSVTNPCEGSRWREMTVSESSGDILEVAGWNAAIGVSSFFTVGMGLMACGARSIGGPHNPVCWAGALGAAYGALTFLTIPFNHVSPFGASSTVHWSCAAQG